MGAEAAGFRPQATGELKAEADIVETNCHCSDASNPLIPGCSSHFLESEACRLRSTLHIREIILAAAADELVERGADGLHLLLRSVFPQIDAAHAMGDREL